MYVDECMKRKIFQTPTVIKGHFYLHDSGLINLKVEI